MKKRTRTKEEQAKSKAQTLKQMLEALDEKQKKQERK